MSDLAADINNTKKKYREIFLKSSEEIQRQIEKLRPDCDCAACEKNCKAQEDIFQKFPDDCKLKNWQIETLKFFENEVAKDVYEKWIKIIEYRKNFSCVGCATCCKLACSEFSFEELKEKARNGDNFATQFTSIFIPYESQEEAKTIYPEYFELLAERLNGEKVYFYHCPKLTADNRCSDYENRPKICRDFPDNPLSILPKSCGFSKWREEVEPVSLMLHSILEISDFYKEKIQTKIND